VKRALLAVLLVTLVAPAPAVAAPELFVRMQRVDTHEPASDWMPLASAPAVNYLGGYEIGYRLETSGFQRVSLTVDAVPDGRPTQQPPFCVGKNGTAGEIQSAGPELQFEGVGTYAVTVTICTSGSTNSGSFGVSVPVNPSMVGSPQTLRLKPLAGHPFVGVRANAPPGGTADIRCALDAAVQPDGSVAGAEVLGSGPEVPEHVFTRPGDWTCVARGVVEGRDDDNELTEFATPWSAPLAVPVASDFQRRLGEVSRQRAKRPRFTFTAEWPALAQGGRATVTIFRITGCRGRQYKLRRVGAYSGTFGAKNVRITMRRPRGRFFVARFTFSGTRLLRAGTDPHRMFLTVLRRKMGFAEPLGFPYCPGYRP
jgi:hypothetical protein